MRQLVALVNAADERAARAWYSDLCLHASVNNAKVEKSFDEIFPEYTDPVEDDEALSMSPENAKLIERLQQDQLARANRQYGKRE